MVTPLPMHGAVGRHQRLGKRAEFIFRVQVNRL